MPFDIAFPSILFFLTALSVFLYPKLEPKIKVLLEERKFRMRDVALLVVVMGLAVSVLVVIPDYAIMAIFLFLYSMALFVFVYSAMPKWYIALILPAIFLLLYFFFWDIPQMDLFAAIFVVFVSVYVGTLFEWKTVTVFAGLLTIMDIIQVFGTRFMVVSGTKMMDLKLPVVITVPSFPYQGLMALGLGDFFLSCLLAIQTAKKYGRRFGYISIAFIAGAFLIFGALQIWYFETLKQWYSVEEAASKAAMPATVFIVCGWLIALGARHIYNSLTAKKTLGEGQ
jgi:presenilin-like A22 family membrane protease